MSVRVYLTGRLAIEVGGDVVLDQREFRGKQDRLLFAYLISERTRPVSREELATIVWGEKHPGSWENALSALISRLNRLLSRKLLKEVGVNLYRGSGEYQIRLPLDAWIDLEAVVSAVDRAESAIRNGDPDRILGAGTVAYSIARRPFLSGIDNYWADSQRGRLLRYLLRALDCICEMCLARNEPQTTVEKAYEAIRLSPYREKSYQLLMRGLVAVGDRAEAIESYHTLRRRLDDELATSPSPEIESLYLSLL